MRGIVFVLVGVLLFVISCASLPAMYRSNCPAALEIQAKCRVPFPQGKWQFVHYIEATLPGGKKGFVMGITVISPVTETIDCVIMTLEGFVLFDARYDQGLITNRAIAPFDRIEFAKGLMDDIRLIFFKPDGPLIGSGILEDGSPVCRYQDFEGKTIDIITFPDNSWEIRQYGKDLRLARTVTASSPKKAGRSGQQVVPDRLELKVHGLLGYELSMNLVSAFSLSE
jgi:hypothetical protein